MLADLNFSAHHNSRHIRALYANDEDEETGGNSSLNSHYGSVSSLEHIISPTKNIRFQVIIWSIERPDISLSRVSIKFRVSLFWNDTESNFPDGACEESGSSVGRWFMAGRDKAVFRYYKTPNDDMEEHYFNIPPLSILNANSFNVIGAPDVTLLRRRDGLMRWTSMYKAVLTQDEMTVTHYPHDEHFLLIKLGILQQRNIREPWDRRKWRLGLATADDSADSIRVPYGMVVDSIRIPEFELGQEGAKFELVPLSFGNLAKCDDFDRDKSLEVKVRVIQESGYYDKNIIPLLLIIAVVGVTITVTLDAVDFFQRGLLCLNCAFVEVSLRMSIDSRLPRVKYQIKLQRIMNHFFYILFFLVIESGVCHLLIDYNVLSVERTEELDLVASLVTLCYAGYLARIYYKRPKSLLKTSKWKLLTKKDKRLTFDFTQRSVSSTQSSPDLSVSPQGRSTRSRSPNHSTFL